MESRIPVSHVGNLVLSSHCIHARIQMNVDLQRANNSLFRLQALGYCHSQLVPFADLAKMEETIALPFWNNAMRLLPCNWKQKPSANQNF